MNIRFPSIGKPAHFLRKLLGIGLVVWMAGAPFVTAQAAVTVDQEPLVIQRPLPPNMVLMLDDSGSMASDYMPDWNYLADRSSDGLRDSLVNGTYYDPGQIYSPPPKADGSYYPDSGSDANNPLGTAYIDGFHTSYGTQDVTQYYGSYRYYEYLQATVDATYDPVPGCNGGDTLITSGTNSGKCQHEERSYTLYDARGSYWNPKCNQGDYYSNRQQQCVHVEITYTYYSPTTNNTCPSGGSYDATSGKCVRSQDVDAYLFTYTTGPVGGPYTRHYVGKNSADCAVAAALGSDCDFSAYTQQNVANWFSYYRTRILMAKSGVMNSFSNITPDFRIGFGSINNRNITDIKATGHYTTFNSDYIAQVQPFGDGSSGTQKAYLWDWLANISPNNSTPLRKALDAVGQYYETAQPWQTSGTDTTELTCRQSYTILTTDGFWNGSAPSTVIGNADGSAGDPVTSPDGKTANTYTVAQPYSDDQSDTLADVAMKYWKTDLRTSVSNEVPVPANGQDPAFWQHMVTFTLGLGFDPVGIKPSGTSIETIQDWADHPNATDANGNALYPIANFSWPTPTGNSINNIADLAHAGINGHGGFYSAKNSKDFANAIKDALARARSRNGSGSSLAANSTELKTGTVTYQAVYVTEKWEGDLRAYPLDPVTGDVAKDPSWNAAQNIPSAASRNIYTYNPSTGQAVAFKDISSLSSAEQSALGSNATEQQAILDYLRGDPTNEQKNVASGTGYRNRSTPLGDIVSSQPIYIGAPSANDFYNQTFTGSADYDSFVTAKLNRTPEMYVASNDGMLHAFDAGSGKETYAYMPAAVITDGIKNLADPDYGSPTVPHQYFNDGELTAANVYYGSAWHTVLVGTTGRGTAKAVYALDVTNPASIQFLWERSAGDGKTGSDYIGQMTGKPVIAQTANGQWSVIMGNGYNSTKGVSALLQFDISTGAMTVYPTSDTTANNGLAAPVVWIDDISNGLGTTAYAGDLHGNVWSFKLNYTSSTPPTGTLLFTATDGSKAQPITSGMLAGRNPDTGDRWLFFGTGQYLNAGDLNDLSVQSWYGIIVDTKTPKLISNLLTNGRSSLQQRYIVAETPGDDSVTPAILPARAITPAPTTPDMTGKSGWFIDLETPVTTTDSTTGTTTTTYMPEGERMVTTNQFQGSLLLGTTRIPLATDPCNPSGRGWIMAIDPFTGTNPQSNFFDVNGDGSVNAGDSITVGGKTYASAGLGYQSSPNNPIFVGNNMYTNLDNNDLSILKRKTSGNSGQTVRVSWRELTTQ
ncbi:pilus assembly protein [Oleiagrimonas soli]|uniref:Type IV pilus assembly protein PilY1 n=1 Tax=Oleiagrimonas soli TaxID=1543381 RepID=A0A099CY14_9GAMM|nr:PilC/PilY family type IV pilus protein [Oleiagrimonas soli]KGI77935.1 hypothetical protein LF63_0105950 [Oleiagrimonas soli]MBB6183694.1 type IV pilus assembly protein PilY1 [Oleiagrimonas soli]